MTLRKLWRMLIPAMVTGIILVSCQSNEFSVSSNSAGLNGDFEITEAGYPVNWAFFPNPENTSTFAVFIDTTTVMEGSNSLRLETILSEYPSGFRSRRVAVEAGQTYTISLWVRHDGCCFAVHRVLQDATGKTNMRSDVIMSSSTSIDQWRQYETTVSIADGEAYIFLKFILDGTGTFWFDNVTIEPTNS